jgi:hypothetical protein
MNKFDDALKNGWVCFGHDAVTKVENMCRVSAIAAQNVASRFLNDIPRRKRKRRIKVALKRNVCRHACSSDIKWNSPIDTDDIGASLRHEAEQLARSNTEMNSGHVEVGNLCKHSLAVGKNEFLVVGRTQGPGP